MFTVKEDVGDIFTWGTQRMEFTEYIFLPNIFMCIDQSLLVQYIKTTKS